MSIAMVPLDPITGTEEEKTLLKEFTSPVRLGYVSIGNEGVIMPSRYTEAYSKVMEFQVRDDDVFVASFPKTGEFFNAELFLFMIVTSPRRT